jgi:hypothetical protein
MGKRGIGDGRLIATLHVQSANTGQMGKGGIGDGRLIASNHDQFVNAG